MICPILWNPINFIDGEGRWLILELAIIFLALISSKILSLFVRRVSQKSSSEIFIAITQALHRPLFYFIWYLALLYSFDLVTDELLSYSHPTLWAAFFKAGIILTAGWFLVRLKNTAITYASKRGEASPALDALSKMGTVAIVVLILILLNDMTELNVTTLLTFGGIGGIALAFASQELISNFFGGLIVQVTRPFTRGDSISVPAHNIIGSIEEIGWYQTRIRDDKMAAVYVPNALFTKSLAVNLSQKTHCVLDEKISVEAKPEQIEALVDELSEYLSSHPDLFHDRPRGSRSECKALRGKMLIHIVSLVLKHGGKLTQSKQVKDIC